MEQWRMVSLNVGQQIFLKSIVETHFHRIKYFFFFTSIVLIIYLAEILKIVLINFYLEIKYFENYLVNRGEFFYNEFSIET